MPVGVIRRDAWIGVREQPKRPVVGSAGCPARCASGNSLALRSVARGAIQRQLIVTFGRAAHSTLVVRLDRNIVFSAWHDRFAAVAVDAQGMLRMCSSLSTPISLSLATRLALNWRPAPNRPLSFSGLHHCIITTFARIQLHYTISHALAIQRSDRLVCHYSAVTRLWRRRLRYRLIRAHRSARLSQPRTPE